MTNQKIFLHSVLLSYLLLTGAALCFTLFRIELLPPNIFVPFYGMMAPFQGYTTENYELVARGRPQNGVWTEINLQQYVPAGRGEFSYRGFTLEWKEQQRSAISMFKIYAKKLHDAEARNGRAYDQIQLIRRRWPVSPAGYHYLNRPEFRTDTVLYTFTQ